MPDLTEAFDALSATLSIYNGLSAEQSRRHRTALAALRTNVMRDLEPKRVDPGEDERARQAKIMGGGRLMPRHCALSEADYAVFERDLQSPPAPGVKLTALMGRL